MPPALLSTAEARTCRKRLLGEQQRCLGKVVGVGAPDHAGLGEERLGPRRPTRLPRPCARRRRAGRTVERPPTTASSGLRSENRRANRANLRALPKDSRYSAAAVTSGSSYHAASRSLLDTSAVLPSDTKLPDPEPELTGAVQQHDPDAAGLAGDRQTAGRRRLLGVEGGVQPDRGVVGQHARGSWDPPDGCRGSGPAPPAPAGGTAPAWSSSPNPELITTAARTPAAAASSSAEAVASAGTAITARSTGSGTSWNDGKARTPDTCSCLGCTTTTRPE